ncbi:MAG: NAD(+) diphosphatase [Treponema sp.]|nr:NAD(+) diphosphatase [Treponema sp.]
MKNYVFFEKDIILKEDDSLPDLSDLDNLKTSQSISGFYNEKALDFQVMGLSSLNELPKGLKNRPLREYFACHSEEENYIASRAKALLGWFNSNKFCSACGAPLSKHQTLTALECTSCKKIHFPRVEPCIIVLVQKEDKILLARHTYRNQDIYACLAGFIESGESAEHAVHREVFEETGLKIKNVKYRGSQGWPFPDQLMLGFTAEYESGDLVLQPEEIAEAKWFDRNNCPASPKPGSIAYKLIHNEI